MTVAGWLTAATNISGLNEWESSDPTTPEPPPAWGYPAQLSRTTLFISLYVSQFGVICTKMCCYVILSIGKYPNRAPST